MGDTKICLKCGRELPTSEFSKCKNNKDGLQVYCKECNKQYREEHKEDKAKYMKKRYQNNKEDITKYNKQYYQNNKEAKLEYAKQYREEHKREILEKKKQYYTDNRETKLEYMKQHYSTLRGYCGHIRRDNIREDRKYDRIGNELPNDYPTVEDYMELLQLPDFYDGKQYNFNEMGLDRIDNSLPHILSNVVPCTTKHNAQRGRMPFEEFCLLFT